ncbi:MAG TPA: hypothetical protein ENN60_01165 [archaeon]|nr:hypothetical protein [archaeon]
MSQMRPAAPRQTYGVRRYPYPASYAYYPTRTQYQTQRRNYYPLLIVALGVMLAVYGLVSMPKLDPELKALADTSPDQEVAALVFCNPCTGVDGERVATGKLMVVDAAEDLTRLVLLPGVKQVRFLGKV